MGLGTWSGTRDLMWDVGPGVGLGTWSGTWDLEWDLGLESDSNLPGNELLVAVDEERI